MDPQKLSGTIFSFLHEDEFANIRTKFASLFKLTEFAKGDVLLKEAEPQTKAFIIQEGELTRVKGDIVLERISQGRSTGFFHALEGDPCFASLVAGTEKVSAWSIQRQDIETFFLENPRASFKLSVALAREYRREHKIRSAINQNVSDSKYKVAVFDTSPWVKKHFSFALTTLNLAETVQLDFIEEKLSADNVVKALGAKVVCCFVNDDLSAKVLQGLSALGVELIAMRCAGFDRVDLEVAKALNLTIVRVPAYSPYAVAEHAVALLMTLNRKIHRAYNRVKEGNFSIEGLVGFDLHGKTVGVLGTGKIGRCAIDIFLGFGCRVLMYDIYQAADLQGKENPKYVSLDEVFAESDVISLHAPLTKGTYHLINQQALEKMKQGVYIINTSRGGLLDAAALVEALKSGKVAGAGLDVYEEEKDLFFRDASDSPIKDDVLRDLVAMNNVILTAHQAFLTSEALNNISTITLNNIVDYRNGKRGKDHPNSV